jgi:hypothetical protein
MSNYTAPVEDMGFVLKEVVEIEKLCNETGLDVSTVEILDTVLEAAGKLAKEEIEPINKPGDSEGLKIDGSGKVTTASGLKKPISTLLREVGAHSNSHQPMEDRASHLWLLQVFKRCGILPICLGDYAPFLPRSSRSNHSECK